MEYINLIYGQNFEIGVINKLEGEVLHVKVKEQSTYKVGSDITCVFFGAQFKTKILQVYTGIISLYIPITTKSIHNDQRENPRINVDNLPAILNSNIEEKVYNTKPTTDIQLIDISLTGVGFTSRKNLAIGTSFIYFDTEYGLLKIEVSIKYKEALSNTNKYGCRIIDFSIGDWSLWRKIVLFHQLLELNGSLHTELTLTDKSADV